MATTISPQMELMILAAIAIIILAVLVATGILQVNLPK